ncbi:hypothetical protein GCM10025867_49590 (plasmid) [Frondihabitans sucicola]|uniref:Uncharacterized protein n=1 Tax=Frondihabitans sucicola TaxID=1268041 RepID=A0ABN6YB10_9MICO|nr:hypothetical protein [Frondihabitans sucicola]BDZ52718.1 hypothetical protein GCM10025867_49590 [Frondihabitans sucicola]
MATKKPYAAETSVPVTKSRDDIEKLLVENGSEDIAFGNIRGFIVVAFSAHERQVRFTVPMPDVESPEITRTPSGAIRTSKAELTRVYDQAVRQRWRALFITIKSKFVSIDSHVASWEQEFGHAIVLPDGRTVMEATLPAIERAYATGTVPPLLGITS